MSFTGVQELIVDYLSANVISLTKGTNLFQGNIKPADKSGSGVPEKAVFVNDSLTGGFVQQYCDGGSGTNLNFQSVIIYIRGNSGVSSEANLRTLVNEVYETIRKAKPTGMIGIEPVGTPVNLGEDQQGLPIYSINLTAYKRE